MNEEKNVAVAVSEEIPAKVKQVLENYLENEKEDFKEYLMLRKIAEKYEGKKMTMRFEKDLPEGYRLQMGYNGFEIKSTRFYLTDEGQKVFKTHYLCMNENKDNFSVKNFDEANTPYSKGSGERIEKIERILNNAKELKKLTDAFVLISNAFEALRDVTKDDGYYHSFNNPAYYSILKSLNISSSILSDIKYNKK